MGNNKKGKKNVKQIRNQQQKRQEQNTSKLKPFVSICTPTFNRRPFIPYTIKCYLMQDYPLDRMEWIIIDDGTDPIEDLVKDIPNVRYYKYDEKMTLGRKRNIMHEKSKGDIIVYMDDDDYYPSNRVSHAVDMLMKHPNALCAGSSEIYIWFKHISKMYRFGPYGLNHATAGTFALKRELLKQTKYNETAALAEEKEFLKNYTIPFVQLDPFKTILVFSHEHNTFDKRKLLENPHPQFVRESNNTVKMFIKDDDMYDFYTNRIEKLLLDYDAGKPEMKPDVLKQIKEIEEKRKQEQQKVVNEKSNIIVKQADGSEILLSNQQVVDIIKKQQQNMQQQTHIIQQLQQQLQQQTQIIQELQNKISEENKKQIN